MSQAAEKPERAIDPAAEQVAGVYAKAFLAAAVNAASAATAVDELGAIKSEVLDRFPRLVEVLASGFIDVEEKIKVLDRTFAGRVSAVVLNFLKVLAHHDRLMYVRDIARAARAQYEEMCGLLRVEVATATPLSDAQATKIKEQLRGMLGGEPVLVPVLEPALIAGVVLRVGDSVYDGSVAAQLADIRGRIIDRSIHEIQSRRDRFRYPAGN